jgi:hypothetical protein
VESSLKLGKVLDGESIVAAVMQGERGREQRGEVDGPGGARVLWYPCSATKPTLGVADDVRTPSGMRCLTVVGG